MVFNCLQSELLEIKDGQDNIIQFPSQLHTPIRLAQLGDIKALIELWANSATMKYFFDSTRWNWKGKASELWAEYAKDIISSEDKFLILCDLQDNGLSGFLVARLEKLPLYYQNRFCLTIEDFYLRPKDKKLLIFNQMINFLLDIAKQENETLVLKLEIMNSDMQIEEILKEAGFYKSTSTFVRTY